MNEPASPESSQRLASFLERVRAVIRPSRRNGVDASLLPVRARVEFTLAQRPAIRSAAEALSDAAVADAGGAPWGPRKSTNDAVFGWIHDTARMSPRGLWLRAAECFGGLPGDGVAEWIFIELGDELVAFHFATDYIQTELELHGSDPDGPLLRALHRRFESAVPGAEDDTA